MNKKVFSLITIALLGYALIVLLVVNFWDDNPADMKWKDREEFNRQFIAKLEIGQFTFPNALSSLGKPDITEAKKVNDTYYQVLFYRTQHMKSDGFTTQDECSYLLFIDGTLTEYATAHKYESLESLIQKYPPEN